MSAAFCNKTGHTGFDHRVEPLSRLNAVDLVNGSVGNFSKVVVLASAFQSFGGGQDGRSKLDRPCEQDLGWSQSGLPGDATRPKVLPVCCRFD